MQCSNKFTLLPAHTNAAEYCQLVK